MDNQPGIQTIDRSIRVFLYILIFWLPYSPAVVESCVVISLILWLFKRALLMRVQPSSLPLFSRILTAFKPETTFLNKPIAFFLCVCLLSVIYSSFAGPSMRNFLTKTVEWFIVYFLVVEVFKNKKHLTIALGIFVFTAFSTVLDSLLQFHITNRDIFLGHVIEPGSRATAGFKTSNGLGGYLTVVVPMLMSWALLTKQKYSYRFTVSCILLLSIWSLVITFSRGAWLGVFFGGIVLVLFMLFPKNRSSIYLSLGLLWAVVFLFIAFVLILSSSFDQELLNRIQSISWRFDVWRISFDMVKDRFFLGHGINTFMNVFQAYRGNSFMSPTYAHNCYIQLAAETGVIGLLGFLWIMRELFHRSLGAIKLELGSERNLAAIAIGLLAGVFAYLVHSFFDTQLYSLRLSVYLWFVIGMIVVISKILDTSVLSRNQEV